MNTDLLVRLREDIGALGHTETKRLATDLLDAVDEIERCHRDINAFVRFREAFPGIKFDEKLLDELGSVYARAAVDQYIASMLTPREGKDLDTALRDAVVRLVMAEEELEDVQKEIARRQADAGDES